MAPFAIPDGAPVQPLAPSERDAPKTTIGEHELVLCINRGRRTLLDKFNGDPFRIEPGLFTVTYDAAQHLQRRLIVPGTTGGEAPTFTSYIGIFGSVDGRVSVNTAARCQPFTDDELDAMSESREPVNEFGRPVLDVSDQPETFGPGEGQAHVLEPVVPTTPVPGTVTA